MGREYIDRPSFQREEVVAVEVTLG